MNMPVQQHYFQQSSKSRFLTEQELAQFAQELDTIKQNILDDIGEKDATYIRRVYAAMRYSSLIGRAC